MTTRSLYRSIPMHHRRPNLFIPLLLLAIAASGLILGTHAARHSLADVVRNCPGDKIGLILLNPATGRNAILCEYEPGQWGRLIHEDGREVTSYAHPTRPAMNMLPKALQNMIRGGYTKIEYIAPRVADAIAEILAGLP